MVTFARRVDRRVYPATGYQFRRPSRPPTGNNRRRRPPIERQQPRPSGEALGWETLPVVLTAVQVADLLQASESALRERLRVERHQIEHGYRPAPANPIPVHRYGRQFRFDRDELRAWFEREGRS